MTEDCTCTIACQGQSSLEAEGTDRVCRLLDSAYERGHEDGWNDGYDKGFEDGGKGAVAIDYAGGSTAVNFTMTAATSATSAPPGRV